MSFFSFKLTVIFSLQSNSLKDNKSKQSANIIFLTSAVNATLSTSATFSTSTISSTSATFSTNTTSSTGTKLYYYIDEYESDSNDDNKIYQYNVNITSNNDENVEYINSMKYNENDNIYIPVNLNNIQKIIYTKKITEILPLNVILFLELKRK